MRWPVFYLGNRFVIHFVIYLGSLLLLLALPAESNGQGCSDAGFCSAGSLKSNTSSDSSMSSKASLKLIYGVGERSTTIINLVPEVELALSERSRLQLTLPYVFVSGALGDNNGVGDMILSYSRNFREKKEFRTSITLGTRLPTGKTDQEYRNSASFPMPYQTGLGTLDLILGGGVSFKKWSAAVGLQKVLHHNNKNNYLHEDIDIFIGSEADYFESNKLKRGDDVLLRLSRLFNIWKFNFSPGLLAIYRIQKDQITNSSESKINLEGSDGLTLNVTGSLNLPVTKKFSILVEGGAPVIVRDTRADGLTRSLVLSTAFRYQF